MTRMARVGIVVLLAPLLFQAQALTMARETPTSSVIRN